MDPCARLTRRLLGEPTQYQLLGLRWPVSVWPWPALTGNELCCDVNHLGGIGAKLSGVVVDLGFHGDQ